MKFKKCCLCEETFPDFKIEMGICEICNDKEGERLINACKARAKEDSAPAKQNIDQIFTDIFSAHFPGLKK